MGLCFEPLRGIPELAPGCDLAQELLGALERMSVELRDGDVLVVAQKAVSKSEERWVDLAEIVPSARALELATVVAKDPRFVELVLRESSAIVRAVRNVLITRHRRGYVMANAGIDRSNVEAPCIRTGDAQERERVLLLPEDPDASAAALRLALQQRCGRRLGVIVSDSFGRPWRNGVVNVALGVAGLEALRDLRGARDRAGRVLETTQVATADAIAAGAGLVMGEAAEGCPAVLVRGGDWTAQEHSGQTLVRPLEEDLFK